MECNRTKICICYLITSFLISVFIYTLISSNLENSRRLNRLREEVDEIAHVVLHGAPGGRGGDSKQLTEIIDGILKKRLAGIWDDLYTLKKQLRLSECPGSAARQSSMTSVDSTAMESAREVRVNYASEDLGAKIHEVKAEPVGATNMVRNMLGLEYSANPPINMLRTNMDPGSCFGFKKNRSEVTVKLAKEIYIESFELEHICKRRAPKNDTSSAPKTIEVSCISASSYSAAYRLGVYTYDNSGTSPIQTYTATSAIKARYVRFKFTDNHGHPEYTCVYRVAVYGRQD